MDQVISFSSKPDWKSPSSKILLSHISNMYIKSNPASIYHETDKESYLFQAASVFCTAFVSSVLWKLFLIYWLGKRFSFLYQLDINEKCLILSSWRGFLHLWTTKGIIKCFCPLQDGGALSLWESIPKAGERLKWEIIPAAAVPTGLLCSDCYYNSDGVGLRLISTYSRGKGCEQRFYLLFTETKMDSFRMHKPFFRHISELMPV